VREQRGLFHAGEPTCDGLCHDPSSSTYSTLEPEIASITDRRDALAAEIRAALDAEAFHGQSINNHQARRWIDRADDLIGEAGELTR
jgi:hypothetical protein